MSRCEIDSALAASVEDLFDCLIGPMWLRPESALWYAHMLHAAGSLLGWSVAGRSMEFGCMDGVNTVALLGGDFADDFDVYDEVSWDRSSHLRSTLKDDYFDTYDPGVEVRLLRSPRQQIDLGIDWKESHVRKALRSGAFKEVRQVDRSRPLSGLPMGGFQTVWAPNIYWIEDLGSLLRELARVVCPGGTLVTIGPDRVLLDHMWYRFADRVDEAWLRGLDRGRFENAERHAKTSEEWADLFEREGWAIDSHDGFIPALVGDVYDIGLRPMFPVFLNMRSKLKTVSRTAMLEVKKSWVHELKCALKPLCRKEPVSGSPAVCLWHAFRLRRTEGKSA